MFFNLSPHVVNTGDLCDYIDKPLNSKVGIEAMRTVTHKQVWKLKPGSTRFCPYLYAYHLAIFVNDKELRALDIQIRLKQTIADEWWTFHLRIVWYLHKNPAVPTGGRPLEMQIQYRNEINTLEQI